MRKAVLEKLAAAPLSPGVYLMKDEKGRVIYVGKASNLKKRLSSYFTKALHRDMKTSVLVRRIFAFETFVTSSEQEALILESNLIKHHRPRYNVILKDDKRYPSLRLDLKDDYPCLQVVRRIKNDGALYFGPYASPGAVRQTIKLINRTFRLRKCKTVPLKKRLRPCLNYQMGLCLAPCSLSVDKGLYDGIVNEVRLFLNGRTRELIGKIRREMTAAAEKQAFEVAVQLRDKLFAIERVVEKQVAVTADFADRDVIAAVRNETCTLAVILFVRQGFLQGMRHYVFKDGLTEAFEVIGAFMNQFYEDSRYIPDEILVPVAPDDAPLREVRLSAVKGSKVRILQPKRGDRLRLLNMARENAQALLENITRSTGTMHDLLERLRYRMRLAAYPRRIECFDNSGISGSALVAGRVVFVEGEPDRSLYRRYAIRTVDLQDDYACMAEVLNRRFKKKEVPEELPDLLIVDGGKGQLNIAVSVLEQLGWGNQFDVAGIAKKDETKTEALDKVYRPGRANPVTLSRDADLLLFLQRIRDEAHRLAISYHRKKRNTTALGSRLDSIPGIGRKRKRSLLTHFSSIQKIREAAVEEITALPGMNRRAAEAVQRALSDI